MYSPPIGEQGIWFVNPALAYRETSIGIVGEHMWKRMISDRQVKLNLYGINNLLNVCAPSHKVNVYKHKCNIELLQFFKEKAKNICYEVMKIAILPYDLGRYICERFILNDLEK
jgi:hypothetical protein